MILVRFTLEPKEITGYGRCYIKLEGSLGSQGKLQLRFTLEPKKSLLNLLVAKAVRSCWSYMKNQ